MSQSIAATPYRVVASGYIRGSQVSYISWQHSAGRDRVYAILAGSAATSSANKPITAYGWNCVSWYERHVTVVTSN
jgi:hypothetical protein